MKLSFATHAFRFLLLSYIYSSHTLEAQVQMSALVSNQLSDFKLRVAQRGASTADLEHELPIQRIGGRAFLSMLAKVSADFNPLELPVGIQFGSQLGSVVTLKIDLNRIQSIQELQGVIYIETASKIHKYLERAVQDVRADSVHVGLGLPASYTGEGVLIGVTDWGFDYGHPMFYDSSLTDNRIIAAWDQFKTSGPSPSNYSIGTEFLGNVSVLAAESDTSGTYYGNATHGSHVAGIAGGGGAGISLTGVAPGADFVFASILLDAGAFIDAVSWMQEIAEAEDRRLVINMSWGLYNLGPMDGTSLLSQALNTLTEEGVLIVTSGGNNGDDNFHLKYDFTADTLSTGVSFYPNNVVNDHYGQSVGIIGEAGESFSFSFDLYQVNTKLGSGPWFDVSSSASYVDSFMVSGSDTVYFKIDIDDAHPQSNSPQVRLRLKKPNAGLTVVLHVAATSGRIHLYNLLDQTTGVGNSGASFTSFLGGPSGDNEYGIGEPACAEKVISVGAHSSDIRLPNQTWIPGNIASFSSNGPTMDGRNKPDITAPGVNVLSSISSFADDTYFYEDSAIFNSKTYGFSRFSGTSMSGPMVTGIVALMLEANPYLTQTQAKEILMTTAREDIRTGSIPVGGSPVWGMGKANALEAVRRASAILSAVLDEQESDIIVYPNEAKEVLNLSIPEGQEVVSYRIFDVNGRKVKSGSFESLISIPELPTGSYFLHLDTNEGREVLKFVKG